jgi:hypothetical protein
MHGDERPEHRDRCAGFSDEVKYFTIRVIKSDNDARDLAAGVNIVGVVKPPRWREGEDAFEGGVMSDLLV